MDKLGCVSEKSKFQASLILLFPSTCTNFVRILKFGQKLEKEKIKKSLGTVCKVVIPLVVGVGLFYWLYNNVDVEQMKNILRYDVDYTWIGVMLVISTFSHVFRAMRWRLQLRALGIDAPLGVLVVSIFGTYAVNLVFPRLGEVWRCGYISRRQKAPFTKVVGSMVADRLSDTVTVLTLTLVTMCLAWSAFDKFFDAFPQVKDGIFNTVTSPVTWIGVAVVAGLVVALFKLGKHFAFIQKIDNAIAGLWQGFYSITKMKGKRWFLFYTLLIWGCYFTQLYVCFFAFPFTKDLGIVCALVCFVLSSISMGIPTNGGLGAWHIAIIFGLSLYGVGTFSINRPDANATAFAMLVWGTQTLLLIALGIYSYVYILMNKTKEGN